MSAASKPTTITLKVEVYPPHHGAQVVIERVVPVMVKAAKAAADDLTLLQNVRVKQVTVTDA